LWGLKRRNTVARKKRNNRRGKPDMWDRRTTGEKQPGRRRHAKKGGREKRQGDRGTR